jgi:multidrug efflux pump subunit AcrB
MHWYTAFIGNKVFANLLLAALLVAGALATVSIRRESNPDLEMPFINIDTAYPGADPEEIEEGITEKVAAAIDGMQGVKRYVTVSGEGFSNVGVELTENANVPEVKDRIANAVDSIDTFPERAERPRISQEINEDSVALVFVWGDVPYRQLKEFGEVVRAELQALPEISIVEPFGMRRYEITVEVSEQKLRQHNLTLSEVANAIRRSSLNLPAGTLRLEAEEVRIRALGRRYTGPEFESVVVKALPGGELLTLGQIADIRDTFEENERFATFNGRPCFPIDIDRAKGEDLMVISRALDRYLAAKQASLPDGIHVTKAFDDTRFVQDQIGMLVSNGLLGLLLVVGVLWLFLETRLAFWVAMGIPLSIMGGIVLLWLIGASLNQISLVAMIIVLGMVVDDAIVVGEAIYVHRERGLPPLHAAITGVREVFLPVLASVTTTIAAFLPMAFITGMMGQFMRQMPLVVTTALIVSLVECLFLLPAHLNYAKRDGRPRGPRLFRLRDRVAAALEWATNRAYLPLVRRCVRRRYVTLCAGASALMLTAGIVAGGIVPIMMWPPAEGDHIYAYVESPPGTPARTIQDALDETYRALERVAARTQTKSGQPLVENVYAYAPSNGGVGGELTVQMLSASRRGIPSMDIVRELRTEVGRIPGAIVQTFRGETIGSSDGSDFGIWLTGTDYGRLRDATDELKDKLASFAGAYQIQDNFRPGKAELQVRPKPAAQHLGLSLDDISRQLHAAYQGEEALTLLRGREEVHVRVRLPRAERERISDFAQLRIRTADGRHVPLSAVAEVTQAVGVSTISGINGVRGVRITANVDRTVGNPDEINARIVNDFLPAMLARYPGVSWSYSPVAEDNQIMFAQLQRNGLFAMLAIFIVLCAIFQSYVQPLLILGTVPFGFIGAVLAHRALGIPLSFLSLAGVIALAGVLVNNAIVIVERTNAYLAEGNSLENALARAGARRFRAILLTSATTVFGLGPIIFNQSLMGQIVIPMAVSLAGGLAVGTIFTLIYVPTFIAILNDARRVVYRATRGTWPAPEDVEPARNRIGEPTPAPVVEVAAR